MLGGVGFEEEIAFWGEVAGGLFEDFLDDFKAVIFGVEGDFWFVS